MATSRFPQAAIVMFGILMLAGFNSSLGSPVVQSSNDPIPDSIHADSQSTPAQSAVPFQTGKAPVGRSLAAGDRAPEFTLRDITGKRIALSSHDQGIVLLWFSNLCGGCQAALPGVEALSRKYRGKHVSVMVVSLLGDDTVAVSEVVHRLGATFPFLIDPAGTLYEQYGGVTVPPGTCPSNPQFFILNKGIVTYATHFPGAPIDEIQRRIAGLLSSAEPKAEPEHHSGPTKRSSGK